MGKVLVGIEITPGILFGVSEVARRLGRFEGLRSGLKQSAKDRILMDNVFGNLAIEGNTLSQNQMGQLVNGEAVGAMMGEVQQARAFLSCYGKSESFAVHNRKNLLTGFLLMNEGMPLTPLSALETGENWNLHMKEALELLGVLFAYLQEDHLTHPVLKAAVFHYEMVHIKPFVRYSGAVARLWHRLLLAQYHPVLMNTPLEFLMKRNQQEYVDLVSAANTQQGLLEFVNFSIRMTSGALALLFDSVEGGVKKVGDRLAFARMHFGDTFVTRKSYMQLFSNIGPATASRDLKSGLELGMLEKQGNKARTQYHFVF